MPIRASLAALAACATIATAALAGNESFTALPAPFETRNGPVVWTADGPDALTMIAGPKANWFVPPGTANVTDTAPALLIRPAGDFTLAAKVSLQPKKRWDSGCLVLVADSGHWAKLCIENAQGDGKLSAVSVVNRGDSDDVYTDFYAVDNTLYLRLARKGDAFQLFASQNGKDWRMFRTFALNTGLENLRTGLIAQSPVGDGMTVKFSDIRYEAK